MARKSKQDVAKAKAAKQKKIAIVAGVVFVALLAFQAPKMMKMMHPHPVVAPPAATTTTPAPTVTPADPNTLAAPTLAGAPTDATQTSTTSGDLVSAVPMTVDPGQLKSFQQFASKDPFASKQPSPSAAASAGGSKSGGSSTPAPDTRTTTTPPASPSTPPPPAAGGSSGGSASTPGTAVISVNGELMSVSVDTDFPTEGTVFSRSGALFHLVSLSGNTAKVAIAGGSYADGAATITLKLRTPLTLQNTADGSKYTLILEPQGTAVPTTGAGTAASAPASTTASAVPPTSGATG